MDFRRRSGSDGIEAGRALGWLGCVAFTGLLLVHARQYAFLCDDAYISFRYAQNALLGRGLVFNPGERVEGYSNFLWVLQLVGLGRIGVGPEAGSLALGVLYTFAMLGAGLALLRDLIDRRDFPWAAPLLLAFLAANRSVAIWTTSGLETRSDTLFVLLGAFGTLRYSRRLPLGWLGPAGWAAACLSRPDSILLFALSTLALAVERRRIVPAIRFAVVPAAVVALHFLWRRLYYGEWLPNTYYAKVSEPWWDAGCYFLAQAALEYGLWLAVPLALAGVWMSRKRRIRRGATYLMVLIVVHSAYLARLGGDHFEFRLLDFGWPMGYAVLIAGLAVLGRRIRATAWKRGAAIAGMVAVVFAYGFALPAAAGRAAAPLTSFRIAIAAAVQIAPEDLGAARFLPLVNPLRRTWNALSRNTHRFFVLRQEVHRLFAEYQRGNYEDFPVYEKQGAIPSDTVALLSGGGIFSFLTDLRTIDRYGLTDKVIARNREVLPAERRLAHYRLAPEGYLKKRGVNMVEPIVWEEMPSQFLGQEGLYIIRLPDGRFLTFLSDDEAWVMRHFQGRIVTGA